jgi:hypothetical protein
MNRKPRRPTKSAHVQLWWAVARYPHIFATRIAVVGNGNFDVGSKIPTREPGQPIVDRLVSSGFTGLRLDPGASLQPDDAKKCGAMSEQSADSGRGNEQVPQQLVHLVGYRDPARLPWVRPRRA